MLGFWYWIMNISEESARFLNDVYTGIKYTVYSVSVPFLKVKFDLQKIPIRNRCES